MQDGPIRALSAKGAACTLFPVQHRLPTTRHHRLGKLAAPRIAASLDELPLSVLCDPDRGTLEAVEFCGLHAAETSFAELEVSSSHFSNCQFLSCDFTGALFVDIAFEGCDFSNSIFDSAAFTRCTFNDCKFAGVSFTEALWEQVAAKDCTFRLRRIQSKSLENRSGSHLRFLISGYDRNGAARHLARGRPLCWSELLPHEARRSRFHIMPARRHCHIGCHDRSIRREARALPSCGSGSTPWCHH